MPKNQKLKQLKRELRLARKEAKQARKMADFWDDSDTRWDQNAFRLWKRVFGTPMGYGAAPFSMEEGILRRIGDRFDELKQQLAQHEPHK